jgi:hypothetical protein
MVGGGGGPGGPAMMAGGSRSSKAPKKKRDDQEDMGYTTVMLRNIPNKYTRQMLIDALHRPGFLGDIDYLYLPIDFANRCNVGYCFCNFRTAEARSRFTLFFDGVPVQTCLPGFNSYKVAQVTRAKWQGREENVKRLRSGPELMSQLAQHPEWLPLLLDERGEPLDVVGHRERGRDLDARVNSRHPVLVALGQKSGHLNCGKAGISSALAISEPVVDH